MMQQQCQIKFEQVLNKDEKTESFCKCSICLEVFIEPICCENCENHYCSGCLTKWSSSQPTRSCPLCQELKEKPAQRILKNMLSGLEVECCNKEQGCGVVVRYCEYFSHLQGCEYQMSQCGNAGCQSNVLRKEEEVHGEICLFKLIDCGWCGMAIRRGEMEKHGIVCPERCMVCVICGEEILHSILGYHVDNCPEKVVSCEECGMEIRLKSRSVHLQQYCEKIGVGCSGCLLSYPRAFLKNHEAECGEIRINCLNCGQQLRRCVILINQLKQQMLREHGLANCVQNLKWQMEQQEEKHQKDVDTLQEQIQQLQELMTKMTISLRPFHHPLYRFSQVFKNSEVDLLNKGQFAYIPESYPIVLSFIHHQQYSQLKDRFVFIEVDKPNQPINIQLIFQSITDRFVAFGIADLSNLSHKKDYYKINHLSYLFSSNGVIYNSHASDENGKKRDFKFDTSHHLSLIFDPNTCRVTAHNLTTNQQYQIEIPPAIIQMYGKTLNPVVCLRGAGDQVEIYSS